MARDALTDSQPTDEVFQMKHKEFHDIRIPLPAQRHTALRQAALGARRSLTDLVNEIIEKWLKEQPAAD